MSDKNQKYNHKKIERKWQKFWEKEKIFFAKDFSKKKKLYVLDMFPYPSAEGLHVGHPRGYVGSDVYSLFKRMQGYNVLHPMGWDAFGLPAENFAIKTGTPPKISTERNIKRMRKQLKALGFSYDWSREIKTCDPSYYKWTQWMFLKLFSAGLAYRAKIPANFCPSCKTILANEQVIDGKCERCSSEVYQKEVEQWLFKITAYAERLLKDLDKIDWPEETKEMQRNWIGKSEGAKIKFKIKNTPYEIEVFTTRPDTLFGVSFLVLSPEHPLLEKIKKEAKNEKEIENYLQKTKKKTELERISSKKKEGVLIKGVFALHPFTQKEIPIFVADYVLVHYGTGAVMGVPAHDERDFEFAKRYKLPIIQVIKPKKGSFEGAYEGEGYLINSDKFSGLFSKKAKKAIVEELQKRNLGKFSVCYKLRDWVISRQRYWGCPIPMIFCENCGWQKVPEKDLPVKLPPIKDFKPLGDKSPLAKVKNFVETKCPKCKRKAKRETDTMDTFVCSSWYFLRYADPKNKKEFAGKKLLKYWLPVDLYVGGKEHSVLHLLYARFFTKVLYDLGYLDFDEPFLKLRHQGIILGPDGQKMSKSRGNVINPDDIVEKYGADTLRVYEMFMGPFDKEALWSTHGIEGARRFLERVWKMQFNLKKKTSPDLLSLLHQTIKKVTEDIENFKFNTAISQMMIFLREAEKASLSKKDFGTFLKLLAPFAPHLCEEIWHNLGHKGSIFKKNWPKYDPKLIEKEKVTFIVEVNGKKRDKIEVQKDLSQKEIENLTKNLPKVRKYLEKKKIKKVIFVKNKLINFVVE